MDESSAHYLVSEFHRNELDEIEVRIHVFSGEHVRILYGSDALNRLKNCRLLFRASGVALTMMPPPTKRIDLGDGSEVLAFEEGPNGISIERYDFTDTWKNCYRTFLEWDLRVSDLKDVTVALETDLRIGEDGDLRICVEPLTAAKIHDRYEEERCRLYPFSLNCAVPEVRIVRSGRIQPDVLRSGDSAFTNEMILSIVVNDRDYVQDWLRVVRWIDLEKTLQ